MDVFLNYPDFPPTPALPKEHPYFLLHKRLWNSNPPADIGFPSDLLKRCTIEVPHLEDRYRCVQEEIECLDLSSIPGFPEPNRVMVREGYAQIYEQIGSQKRLITGLPGEGTFYCSTSSSILRLLSALEGKTHFIFYLLCRFLLDSKACILELSDKATYVFSKLGVFSVIPSEWVLDELGEKLQELGCPEDLHVLIDFTADAPFEHNWIPGTVGRPTTYWPILILSPHLLKFRHGEPLHWLWKRSLRELHLPPWNWRDIYVTRYVTATCLCPESKYTSTLQIFYSRRSF